MFNYMYTEIQLHIKVIIEKSNEEDDDLPNRCILSNAYDISGYSEFTTMLRFRF